MIEVCRRGLKGRNFDGVITLTLLTGYEPEVIKNTFMFQQIKIHDKRIETG
jgi:hypothetical protein